MPVMNFAPFPAQNWDTVGNAQPFKINAAILNQINKVFKTAGFGFVPISQNFVQQSFDESWTKATKQFGNNQIQFTPLTFSNPGKLNNLFGQSSLPTKDIAKNAFALEDFTKTVSAQ